MRGYLGWLTFVADDSRSREKRAAVHSAVPIEVEVRREAGRPGGGGVAGGALGPRLVEALVQRHGPLVEQCPGVLLADGRVEGIQHLLQG